MKIHVKNVMEVSDCDIQTLYGVFSFQTIHRNQILESVELPIDGDTLSLSPKMLGIIGEIYNALKGFNEFPVVLELIKTKVLPFLPEQTIHAIKAFREITGYGLRESKDFVDALKALGWEIWVERYGNQIKVLK